MITKEGYITEKTVVVIIKVLYWVFWFSSFKRISLFVYPLQFESLLYNYKGKL